MAEVSSSKATKLKASTFTVAKKLAAEGGDQFKGDNKALMEILKEAPIRKDVAAAKFTNYPQWQMEYRTGFSTNKDILQKILNEWVSAYGRVATVNQLIRLFKEEELVNAAEALETHFKPDDKLVYT